MSLNATPFAQSFFHGAKANLKTGDLITPGFASNYPVRPHAAYIYLTSTLDAAVWGAELAQGEGQGRIYVVEPLGSFEDDPELTDQSFQAIRRNPIAPATRCTFSARSSVGSGIRPSRFRS